MPKQSDVEMHSILFRYYTNCCSSCIFSDALLHCKAKCSSSMTMTVIINGNRLDFVLRKREVTEERKTVLLIRYIDD